MTDGETNEDPVAELEVGESVEITKEARWPVYDGIPTEFYGLDREYDDLEYDNLRFEGEAGDEEIVFEVSGAVTKQEEPEFEIGETNPYRRSWLWRVIGLTIGGGLSIAVAYLVTHSMPETDLLINGQPMTVDPAAQFPNVAAVIGLVMLVLLSANIAAEVRA